MVTAAATLHVAGQTSVGSAADAAQALKPLAGPFAAAMFALGISGHGPARRPGAGGLRGLWRRRGVPLADRTRPRAAAKRGPFMASSPSRRWRACAQFSRRSTRCEALFWSAVINGVVAVPIMADHDADGVQPKGHGPLHHRSVAQGLGLGLDRGNGGRGFRHDRAAVARRAEPDYSPIR